MRLRCVSVRTDFCRPAASTSECVWTAGRQKSVRTETHLPQYRKKVKKVTILRVSFIVGGFQNITRDHYMDTHTEKQELWCAGHGFCSTMELKYTLKLERRSKHLTLDERWSHPHLQFRSLMCVSKSLQTHTHTFMTDRAHHTGTWVNCRGEPSSDRPPPLVSSVWIRSCVRRVFCFFSLGAQPNYSKNRENGAESSEVFSPS